MLSSIVEAFASFKEYRVGKVAKGRPRHPLLGLLMILFLSRVAGCRGWDASADWARAHFEVLRRHLPLWIRPPSADTLRRTAEAYELGDFLDGIEADGEAVHIDGKRARGATGDGRVHHFIEALCGTTVLAMTETGAGAEGPAIAALVTELKLSGRIVTVDAAGATPAVAAAITQAGADFLLAVKDNQPGLRGALEAAYREHGGRAWTSKDRGHGRHEVRRARTITARKVVEAVAAAGALPGIRTLGRIERTRITRDGIATTVHYHVSTRVLSPRRYACHARAHWRIEAMHHVVDGALDEDACRIAKAAGVAAALRRLAFAVIAELRGAFSFRRFAEFIRANPTPLLELCAAPG
jgi:predicted transposase YbfD/YdcC